MLAGTDYSSVPLTTTYMYDAAGNLQTELLPNGLQTTYVYDGLNRLTDEMITNTTTGYLVQTYHYTLADDGTRLSNLEVTYDDTGAVSSAQEFQWAYDALDRLTSETLSTVDASTIDNPTPTLTGTVYTDSYTLDLVGNRLQKQHTDGADSSQDDTITYTYNQRDQLLNSSSTLLASMLGTGNTSYSYDANGSTIGVTNPDGSYSYYVYDLHNRLVGLTEYAHGGLIHQISYVYDASGTRVQSITDGDVTYFLVDHHNPTGYSQIVEEKHGDADATPTVSYIIGLDVIGQAKPGAAGTDDALAYFLYDGHGSVRALTTPAAVIVALYAYDAFGVPLVTGFANTASTELGYSGEWTEPATGKQWLRARIYDVTVGRFTTMDTYGGDSSDPLSLHKYLYTQSNPVNGNDSTGHFLGALIGGALNAAMMAAASSTMSGVIAQAIAVAGGVFLASLVEKAFEDYGVLPQSDLTDNLVKISGTVFFAGITLGAMQADFRSLTEQSWDTTYVVGKVSDLDASNLAEDESTLIQMGMPDQGNFQANWQQNARLLRQVMSRGIPIRDAAVDGVGNLINNTGFLRMERNLMSNDGWTYNPSTRLWSPPFGGPLPP